jgi:CheY-like chemotaxis protein
MTTDAAPAAHVLVIDADEDIRSLLHIILEDAGYTVTVAADGEAALTVLRQAVPLPDLIVLDVRMPLLDGRRFRQIQQADPHWGTIPVIALSAHTEVQTIAHEVGIEVVLPKPFTFAELLATVQRMVY